MPDDAAGFVERWKQFTSGDPRREEILRRVAFIYANLQPIIDGTEAGQIEKIAAGFPAGSEGVLEALKAMPSPGERVRAGEVVLKAAEMFARSTGVNLKSAIAGKSLTSWTNLLDFVREFYAAYSQAESALRSKDEEGFVEYKRRYADFLANQSASGSLADGGPAG